MLYEITYLSKESVVTGECLECPYHFINPETGCGLTGEFLPDDWDISNKPWDKCPVIQCVERSGVTLDKFGQCVRNIRITRSLLLYDMAKKLDISSAELSAIECGRKPVPDWFIPALEKYYNIGGTYARTLRWLAKNRGD